MVHRKKTCTGCSNTTERVHKGLCPNCRQITRPCLYCGNIVSRPRGQAKSFSLFCNQCRSNYFKDKFNENPICIELLKRFPDRKIIYGDLTRVAKEYNISRERVRQIAKKLRFTKEEPEDLNYFTRTQAAKFLGLSPKYMGALARVKKLKTTKRYTRKLFILKQEVEALKKERDFEKSSSKIEVLCTQCHTPKIITRGLLRVNNPRYKGRYFCNRSCFGRWIGLSYGKFNLIRWKEQHTNSKAL
mgnify:CR=1 FL=1